MKKYIISLFITLFAFNACNDGFFDQVPDDRLSYDQVFSTKESLLKYLTSVYYFVPDYYDARYSGFAGYGHPTVAPWLAGSSEGKQVWGFSYGKTMTNNTMTPTDAKVKELWENLYEAINYANTFMKNAPNCKDNELTTKLLNQYVAEARALRAFYYFCLMRSYGPVPIVGDEPSSGSSTTTDLKRTSMDELMKYIVSEFDAVLQSNALPDKSSEKADNSGRVDNAFVMIYKMQTLLYAASPLFNGEVSQYAALKDGEGASLFPQAISEAQKSERWQKAADVAKAFIDKYVPSMFDLYKEYDASGKYDAYRSYREVFRAKELNKNKEAIFYRLRANIDFMQYERTPRNTGAPSGYRASGGVGPSQLQVDAYFMANGMPPINGYNSPTEPIINAKSGYEDNGFSTEDYLDPVTGTKLAPKGVLKAWVGREPRFYADITFSGQIWLNNSEGKFASIFEYGGNSGMGPNINDYAPTGYVVRKSAPLGSRENTDNRGLIIYRVAQLYLDYAEALNEYSPGNSDILKYLNLVRERAGIPGYGTTNLPVPIGKEAMRRAIQQERQVELSFENVRYFDVRRWGIAMKTENFPLVGMNINKSGADFYKRTVLESRTFNPRSYFFPIPQSEIDVDPDIVQNPGW